MITNIITVSINEFRLLLRDRQAFGLLFIMPLLFIVFLTLALKDVYLSKIGKRLALQIVTQDACQDPKELCAQILEEMHRYPYDIQLQKKYNANDKADLTLILPEDFQESVQLLQESKGLNDSQHIQLVFDPTLDQAFRSLVTGHLVMSLQAVLLSQVKNVAGDALGDPEKAKKLLAAIPDSKVLGAMIVSRAQGGFILPNPIQQTVPAWALFGMFFIAVPFSNSMIRDRRFGIFKRLLSFPITRLQLLIGKVLPFLLVNVLQFAAMFAIGFFVLPWFTKLSLSLDFNGVQLLLVTISAALTATTYGLMVSCLAKSPEQAATFGALSVVILAILGGVMIPRFVMPDFMQMAAQVSPLYWGLEAFQDVIVRKASWSISLHKIGVLLCYSLAFAGVSWARFHWDEA